MRRNDICLYLSPDDRAELQSLFADRNTPRKLVWRAEIVLATADGHGTGEIMRRVVLVIVMSWLSGYATANVSFVVGLRRSCGARAFGESLCHRAF
jgi:hypothetical protein